MNTSRKLTAAEVEEIKTILKEPYWGIQTKLAKEYNVSRRTIQRIIDGTY